VAIFDFKILVKLGCFILQPKHNTYQIDNFKPRYIAPYQQFSFTREIDRSGV